MNTISHSINSVSHSMQYLQPFNMSTSTSVLNNASNENSLRNELAAKLLLALCSIIYASNYMFTKEMQINIAPSMISFLRFFISSIFFIPHFISNVSRFDKHVVISAIEVGILCGIGFISQSISLIRNPTSKVSFFCAMGVIMPPLFAFFEQQPNKLKLQPHSSSRLRKYQSSRFQLLTNIFDSLNQMFPMTSLLALGGGIVLEMSEFHTPQWSDLCLLITPLSFSLCFYKSDILVKKQPSQSATVTSVLLSTTAFMCFVWSIITGSFPTSQTQYFTLASYIFSQHHIWRGFLYTGIVATALTSLIEQWAMKYVTSAQVSIIYTLEPVFATIFGLVFLNERITAVMIIGAVFILSACYLDSKKASTHVKGEQV